MKKQKSQIDKGPVSDHICFMKGHKLYEVLNRLYRRNPHSKAYIIDIRIQEYGDLFNDLDPSPLRRRDLDQDFITYLEESSADIPLKHSLDLQISCPFAEKEEEKEIRIIQGVKSYYQMLYQNIQRKIIQLIKNSLIYFMVGVIFLFLSLYFSKSLSPTYIHKLVAEGMIIGGWVFLWESLALAVFKSSSLRRERRRIQRIIDSRISFIYG